MAYIVMAYIAMAYIAMVYIVMAYIAIAYIVMACMIMAHAAMAYVVMAYIVMAYILVVDIVMVRSGCTRLPGMCRPRINNSFDQTCRCRHQAGHQCVEAIGVTGRATAVGMGVRG